MKNILKKLLIGSILAIGFVASGLFSKPAEAAIGDTIAQTFPDANLAQAVADNVSAGDVNAILTQDMVNGFTYFFGDNLQISDLTGIGHLTSLQMLGLSNNQITSVPSEIGNLPSLSLLNLSFNQITTLPPEIGNLHSLSVLTIGENKLTSLPEEIGNLTGLNSFNAEGNQLTSLPQGFLTIVSYLGGLIVGNNLLPSDYEVIIQQNGNSHGHQPQDQLEVGINPTPVIIKNQNDLDTIDYASLLRLQSGKDLSLAHTYILENLRDENLQPVSINDFIQNGIVQKSGKLFAQVRATGTGVFPNTSDHAITTEFIELNFEVTYYNLSFNLNGALGTAPTTQSLIEGTTGNDVVDPIREGFTFKGWNTSADGTGLSWTPGTTPMIGSDVTLYAQWGRIVNLFLQSHQLQDRKTRVVVLYHRVDYHKQVVMAHC